MNTRSLNIDKSTRFSQYFNWYCILLLVVANLRSLINQYVDINIFYNLILLVSILLVAIGTILEYKNATYTTGNLVNISAIIILGIISYIFNNAAITVICIYSLIVFFVNGKDLIKIFGISQIIIVICLIIFALFGKVPIFQNIYNSYLYTENGTHVLTLGTNKNLLGLIFFNIYIYIFEILKNINVRNIYLLFTTGLFFIVEYGYIKDRTIAFLLIIFLIIYFIWESKRKLKKIEKFIIIFLPIVLTLISIYLSINYGKYTWMININHILSGRLIIWNDLWNQYSVSWLPININLTYLDYSTGMSIYKSLPLDGFFALGILQYGIIIFGILIIWITIVLKKLCQSFLKNKYILLVMLIFVLLSFSESSIVNSSTICLFLLYVLGATAKIRQTNL